MKRRPARLAIAVLLLLAVMDTAVWWVATARLRSAFAGWQSSLVPRGWTVTSDPPEAAGWPWAARLRLRQARLGQADAAGFAWSAAEVTLGVTLLHPGTLVLAASGAESLAGPGWPTIRFHAAGLAATARLGSTITAAQADASGLVVASPAGDAMAQSAHVEADWTQGAIHVRADAGPIAMPGGHRWGLGQTITTAAIEVVAHGAWPRAGGRDAAAGWRDAGGRLDITHLAGQWGTLDLHGSGRATLDDALQPRVDLALTVIDPQAAVAMLGETGAISRNAATAAGAVLGLMVLPARLAGQPAVLDLPLRLEAGTVSLGQIPIARVPPLVWPQAQGISNSVPMPPAPPLTVEP